MINHSTKITKNHISNKNGFFSLVCIEKTMEFVVFLHSMLKTVHMLSESTASKKWHTLKIIVISISYKYEPVKLKALAKILFDLSTKLLFL